MTEVWFRNPDLYIRECTELHTFHLAWDRGYLVKKRIDPSRFAELHLPATAEYRMLLVGDQGTAELTPSSTAKAPTAVYPTWDYTMDHMATLEEMLATPVGEQDKYVNDLSTPVDERPVAGQEHRVVIIRVPPALSGPGRKFYRVLDELQGDYPDAIVHVHGLYSWAQAFGSSFRSVDIDPRTTAQKGKVVLPVGKEVTFERAAQTPQWVTILGYKPVDLKIPRNRCMFNMRSAQWAGEHFKEVVKFKTRGVALDPDAPDADIKSPTTISSKSTKAVGTVNDKVLCDVCTLQGTCKYFRSGGVCAIPNTEPARLAAMFQTRDPDRILEGLGTIIAANTNRLERALAEENEMGGKDGPLDPEVTKLMNSIFDSGTKLAKLLAPARFSPGAKIAVGVQVGAGGGAPAIANMTPQALIASLVAEAERRGIPRESITPSVLDGLMRGQGAVIDVAALEPGDDDEDDEDAPDES